MSSTFHKTKLKALATEGRHTGNSRNGNSAKTFKGDQGEVVIDTLGDRAGSFVPQLIKKEPNPFNPIRRTNSVPVRQGHDNTRNCAGV